MNIFRKMFLMVSTFLGTFAASAISVFAVEDGTSATSTTSSGAFDSLGDALTEMAGQGSGLVVGVTAITLVVVGLCFILPVRRLNEFAKEHVFAIILGAAIVIGATAIAQGIGGMHIFGQ